MDDILWSIDPNNDNMQNFMLRFCEYVDALKIQHNAQIDVLIDKRSENLNLQMKVRNEVFSLFKSGITNTINAGASSCRIHIAYDRPNLVYTLEFDTAGMNMTQLNNQRQRTELMERLEELDATLDFKEHKANAVFVLTVPVKNEGI